jgi:hypothetical protein
MKEKYILLAAWIIAMPLIGSIIFLTRGIGAVGYVALAIILQHAYTRLSNCGEWKKCAVGTFLACIIWMTMLFMIASYDGRKPISFSSSTGLIPSDDVGWWLVMTALSLGGMAVIHFFILIGLAVRHAGDR